MRTRLFIFAALFSVFFYSVAAAEIWYVKPDGSGDAATIQAAIDAAAGGDVVLLAKGTFSGAGNRDIDFGGKALVVKSERGAEVTVIDCDDAGRGFHFHSAEGSASRLEQVTIMNGYSPYDAGGIYCENSSSPLITGCIVIGCNGDGIGVSGSSPTIEWCTIVGGVTSTSKGIAIGASSPLTTISHCTIVDNGAEGIRITSSSSALISNTIIAFNNSGGITCPDANTTVTACDIHGNTGGNGDAVCGTNGGGNIFDNPQFCATDDYRIDATSPCAPSNSTSGLIGAWSVGCGLPARQFEQLIVREQTGSIGTYTFTANDARIYTTLGLRPSSSTRDFGTSATEYYDVYFSDPFGNLANLQPGDPLPADPHITFLCWDGTGSIPDIAPSWQGAGNNLESVTIQFDDGSKWYARQITNDVWGNCNEPLPNTVFPITNLLGPPDNTIIGMGGGTTIVTVRMGPEQTVVAGHIDKVDAAPSLLGVNVTHLAVPHEAVASGGTKRIGAVADGTSRLLIRYRVAKAGLVTATLEGDDAGLLGSIDPLNESSDGKIEATTSTVLTSVGYQAHFVYTPPNALVRPGDADNPVRYRTVRLRLVMNPDDGSPRAELLDEIEIRKPPVMLVHGIWSDSTNAWSGSPLSDLDRDWGFWSEAVDYGGHTHRGIDNPFIISKLRETVQDLLGYWREHGVACDQVNVVAHSMGGVVMREWARDVSEFYGEDSFEEGLANMLVTVDTPHLGTPLADNYVDIARNAFNPLADSRYLPTFLILRFVLPYGTSVEDLTTTSTKLDNLGYTQIPCWAIRGEGGSDHFWNAAGVEKLLSVVYAFLFPLFPDAGAMFGEPHDYVVPSSSQAGMLPDSRTTINALAEVGEHTTCLGTNELGSEVVPLLQLGATPLMLADGFLDPELPTTTVVAAGSRQPATRLANSDMPHRLSSFVQLTICAVIQQPMANMHLAPGQTQPIDVDFGGQNVSWAALVGDFGILVELDPDGVGTLTVPERASGPIKLEVVAITDDGSVCNSDPVIVYAVPSTAVEELNVMPRAIAFDRPGERQQLVVSGVYGDGVRRAANHGVVGTSYSSSNSATAAVDAGGVVKALSPGVTNVFVTNGQLQELVQVSVANNPANQPPVAVAGGPYEACVGERVCLDASGSSDPDIAFDVALAYDWDLNGDGEFDDASGVSPCVLVDLEGVKTISLRVTDLAGATSTASATIEGLTEGCGFEDAKLDIKPGSCPNPLNVKVFERLSKNGKSMKGGVLPVAILGASNFDVDEVDVSTLLLEGAAPIRHGYEDVSTPVQEGDECECTTEGSDGYMDLTLKFMKSEVVAALGPVSDGDIVVLTLSGQLNDGTPFEATDCVNVIGRDSCEEPGAPTPIAKTALGFATPNPFNPVTRIHYSLKTEDVVSLNVYDVTGKLVKSLVSGVIPAGEHFVEWNAGQIPSGIYFYRLTVGNFVETRKLILLK